jgi:hypothetical protein
MEHKFRALHGVLHTAGVEKITFEQGESRAIQRAAEEFPLARGEVIEADHFMAERQKAVCQCAADKACTSRYKAAQSGLLPGIVRKALTVT